MNRFLFAALCVAPASGIVPQSRAATNVKDLGLLGDGETDDTAALQKALAEGRLQLHFPGGNYVLGTVELPGHTALHFAAMARVKIAPDKIKEIPREVSSDAYRSVLSDNINLRTLEPLPGVVENQEPVIK